MNLQNIFSEIENVDPEVYERFDTRRSAMKQFVNVSGKIALAAMPLALGSMFKKAYGQAPSDVLDVLRFGFLLEQLEARFYIVGLNSPAITSAAGAVNTFALSKIRDHEVLHREYLRGVLTAVGATPSPIEPTFDFTGGATTVSPNIGNGPFKGFDTQYDIFLAVAQTLEDTGVRAYKGQAGRLINNKPILTAALNIHSVEARHAARIRRMRRLRSTASGAGTFPAAYTGDIKPWIEGIQSNISGTNPTIGATNPNFAAAVQANYNGEDLATQLGVNIAAVGSVSSSAATASFDEPLTKAVVEGLVDGFIV